MHKSIFVSISLYLFLRLHEFFTLRPGITTICMLLSLDVYFRVNIVTGGSSMYRVLTPDSAPSLRSVIRTAARARLTSAMNLIESFHSEHVQSFWGFAAAARAALVGAFAGLLWTTSPQMDGAVGYVEQLEKLLWVLQVRASAAPFAREVLRLLHEEVGDLAAVKAATFRDS